MKIVIPSCYAYRQCWAPWVACKALHWPDCPYEVRLLTDRGSNASVKHWRLYEDKGFCGNLLRCCLGADDNCIIIMLDDHWICGKVLGTHLQKAIEGMTFSTHVGCFRLHPSPGPTRHFSDWHGDHEMHRAYRISTAPSIWRVSYLIKLLELLEREKPTDEQYGFKWPSAGYFEIAGSLMSMTFPETILAASVPIIPFWNSAIVRGQWCMGVVEEARKLGVVVDTSDRQIRRWP